MDEMADLFDGRGGEEYERNTERYPVELGFMHVENTVFACDALGDLCQHNARLLTVNKELLARCDLIEAELAALKEAARPVARGWGMVKKQGEDAALNCAGSGYRLSAEQLDALAALVGEE